MKRRAIVFLGLLALSGFVPVWGQEHRVAEIHERVFENHQLEDLELIVVQHGGRRKPLGTLAREMVRFITGKRRYHDQEPIVTYLSWMVEGDQWTNERMIAVRYLPLRQELGLDPTRERYSITELRDNTRLLEMFRVLDEKERNDESLNKIETEARLVGSKILALNETFSGEVLRVIPNPMDLESSWFNFPDVAQAPFFDLTVVRGKLREVIEAFQTGDGDALGSAAVGLRQELAGIAPEAYPSARAIQSEHQYNRLNPFHTAWMFYVAAFVLLLVGFSIRGRVTYWIGMTPLLIGFGLNLYGMTLRVLAAGRPPVSNIYESMIFVAAGILLFALIFEIAYRSRIFALTAAGLGVIALGLSENLPISSEISPLVPVLRSTTWLTFHVLTMLLGYSAAFLAGGLAFVGLGTHASGRGDGPFAVRLDRFHYRVVQVAVLFLGAGIILGGVWANQSWGRYWGWDPKETWALISLLVYLVIIHGRFAGWLRRFGTNVASVIGLNMVIMTYYGVNYFLVGLHSYAGGTAFRVPVWVTMFLAAEVVFVLASYWAVSQRRRHKPRSTTTPSPQTPGSLGA